VGHAVVLIANDGYEAQPRDTVETLRARLTDQERIEE
jgi:hypothetical protein